MMAIARSLPKRSALACNKNGLTFILDQRELTFENVNELILVAVPMALTRPLARRQRHEVYAKVCQSSGITKAFALTPFRGSPEWVRVASAQTHGYGAQIDFRHCESLEFCESVSTQTLKTHEHSSNLEYSNSSPAFADFLVLHPTAIGNRFAQSKLARPIERIE
jgi:hypothetical protein